MTTTPVIVCSFRSFTGIAIIITGTHGTTIHMLVAITTAIGTGITITTVVATAAIDRTERA